ncbi:Conjugative transposon protein TcpC (plasmid) [Mycobacterium sp. THAF192]|nr:Conjugative transposon protein TcpC [Mycobacterium sp. THAF192]
MKLLWGKAMPWVIYPCALLGGLNACTSACSSDPAAVDPVVQRGVEVYGSGAMAAYLASTSRDPSPAAAYFEPQQLTALPPVPADIVSSDSHAEQLSPGRWSVSTVVTSRTGALQEYMLPVIVTGAGEDRRYSTVGLPSRRPGIQLGSPIEAQQAQELSLTMNGTNAGDAGANSNPAATTVEQFLTAWLTGDGDPQRFAKPGAIPTWEQAPFTQIELVSATTPGNVPTAITGTVTVTATVTAHSRYAQQLTYVLTLVADNGQWIVQAIDDMPPVDATN